MTKIVYNACYGGFGLSSKAAKRYTELTGKSADGFGRQERRDDPLLAQVVEELGSEASGPYADLQIRDVPSGTKYRIDEYDGFEAVVTVDEYEWSVA